MTSTYLLVAGDARVDKLAELAAGSTLTAVVAGPREVADSVAGCAGISAVTWLGDPGDAPAEAYAAAVADLVATAAPDLVLAAGRPAERVLAGAVAARLGAPAVTMAEQVSAADGTTEIVRGAYGGIVSQTLSATGPVVVVAEGGAVGSGGSAPVTEASVTPDATLRVVETRPSAQASVDLGRAQRIVAVGRGLKAQADLAAVEELATALGAETACSRPLAEGVGWFSHDRYVGVTGQHVSPDLYLALGISGQLQHVVGARGAGTIVAVNSDKDCPYFAEADYCVVGDLYQVVPALTEALR